MVLEARYKAEKVWYPVVWDKPKDADNVIDYDIHDEITIDNSSVFNANNDTTTGMANVIPWVNAPKLIASTSICWIPDTAVFGATLSGSRTLNRPDDPSHTIWQWTVSDSRGEKTISVWDWGAIIPTTWWYQLDISYPLGWSNRYIVSQVAVRRSGQTVMLHTHTWLQSQTQETETLRLELKQWDMLNLRVTLYYVWTSTSYTTNASWKIVLTKI